MRSFFLALAALSTAACAERPAATPGTPGGAAPDIRQTTFAPALGVDLAAMQQTPRGVWIRDLTVGTGDSAVAGRQVAIHYTGTFTDGKQFDANGPADAPFEFRLAAGEVVPGFDEGVAGMRVGGRRQVVIPPSLGYGAQANGPIPANSILVFVIELVSVR